MLVTRNVCFVRISSLSRPKFQLVSAMNSSSNRDPNNANLDREILLYSSKKATAVSLKSLLQTGKGELLENFHSVPSAGSDTDLLLYQVASFLHRELPVRIAHRITHLESIPFLHQSRKFNCIV
jgi:hypothetical protein